jgi:gliding motility-associated-like protein
MKLVRLIFICIACVFCYANAKSQACTTLGQTPSTAFPVCGTANFVQNNVPICSSVSLFVPGCSGGASSSNYENKNPFWYKFTCYTSGTFSFTLTPANNGDDYDWQLYDVTGLDPDQVYTNRNIIVTGNWSGSSGQTGASSNGVNFIQCASAPAANAPRFAKSPNIIQGHDYILLISHYTDSQSGYTLNFGGGTANITDPVEPHLLRASAPCDGSEIRIKVNKKMKCRSLAANGSDFVVVTPANTILVPISATSFQCSAGFDLDSAAIFLSTTLPAGVYKLRAVTGSDGNTLRDNCDRDIPVGEEISFTVYPLFPTPMDSVTKPKCAPQKIELVFPKRIKCNSIAADGSDFFITGTYPITITGATGADCTTGESAKIILQLSAPLQVAGNFFVNLKVGSDGNTLLDECNVQSITPDNAAFVIKDTVNADFTFTINLTCIKNTINYAHNGANTVNAWQWIIPNQPVRTTQNPTVDYIKFGPATSTTLIVSNGVCTDTSKQDIIFDNYLKAQFETPPYICPEKPVTFKNTTIGNITNWNWTFGNGNTSTQKDPADAFYINQPTTDYNAFPQLIATNNYGCKDTAINKIQILFSCFISVPSAFTPNGDGINDYLSPIRKFNGSDLNFSIYNRFGQRIFYTNSWDQRWDGKYKGEPQMPGTYAWTLDYVNLKTGNRLLEKGTTVLIR